MVGFAAVRECVVCVDVRAFCFVLARLAGGMLGTLGGMRWRRGCCGMRLPLCVLVFLLSTFGISYLFRTPGRSPVIRGIEIIRVLATGCGVCCSGSGLRFCTDSVVRIELLW